MTNKVEKGRVGQPFADFLREQGICEDTTEHAVRRDLAFQLAAAMKGQKITRVEMARRLATIDHVDQPVDHLVGELLPADRLLPGLRHREGIGSVMLRASQVSRPKPGWPIPTRRITDIAMSEASPLPAGQCPPFLSRQLCDRSYQLVKVV